MALKKPMVVSSTGQPQVLQAGDSISIPEYQIYVADATLLPGSVVYPSAAGHVGLAKADALSTAKVSGLSSLAVTSGASGAVQNGGILTLTTGQWDAVAGTTGGLTFNTVYYLSDATAGLMSATAPTAAGHVVVPIGIAQSTTDFLQYNNGFSIQL